MPRIATCQTPAQQSGATHHAHARRNWACHAAAAPTASLLTAMRCPPGVAHMAAASHCRPSSRQTTPTRRGPAGGPAGAAATCADVLRLRRDLACCGGCAGPSLPLCARLGGRSPALPPYPGRLPGRPCCSAAGGWPTAGAATGRPMLRRSASSWSCWLKHKQAAQGGQGADEEHLVSIHSQPGRQSSSSNTAWHANHSTQPRTRSSATSATA